MVAAIEDGFIQRQIENSAYEYQQEIEKGERIIVGVNEFQIAEQTKPPLLRVDPEVENAQVRGLKALREKRDNKKVAEALANLSRCARTSANLMPERLAAVKTYATLGEICQVLRVITSYSIHYTKLYDSITKRITLCTHRIPLAGPGRSHRAWHTS